MAPEEYEEEYCEGDVEVEECFVEGVADWGRGLDEDEDCGDGGLE